MFFDLNFPVHHPQHSAAQNVSKKNKGKQPQQPNDVSYSPAQLSAIETRLDLLVHLGYTVIALNQTVQSVVNPKSHVNILDPLLAQLRPRQGIVLLKRLTIVLDQDSEKGFGLTPANAALFKPYDLISLVPTTLATFSLACLTHSQPSALTAHIISLPLTLRLDFRLKHTLVRTALKHGVVFEITYVGALGGENDTTLTDAGAAESGALAKRNWWATAKEVTRVTKGKGLIISSGVVAEADFRAAKDVANLVTLLGLPQEASHSATTKIPKSLVLRAQTRQTYRAVFSDPVLVIPEGATPAAQPPATTSESMPAPAQAKVAGNGNEKKRAREEDGEDGAAASSSKNKNSNNAGTGPNSNAEGSSRKKKRKKNNQEAQ
ncbi:RNase P subunit p30-domain-containing protein [Favolaschia claudopus]|uniref:RNase P subunit p30-domain-containing protein n=1 Tax=Favolaschia claudopus TaxID=2862362 RepID=A0AAW0DRG2_9AGAR